MMGTLSKFREAIFSRIPGERKHDKCIITTDLIWETLFIGFPGTNLVITVKESDIDPGEFYLELNDGDDCLGMDYVKKCNLIYKVSGMVVK